MSSGVTLTCLFFASVEAGRTLVINGMISSAIAAMCRPTASTWLLPKFSSFDQMSFTLIGLIPGGRGACFGGEKKSLSRPPNPPKFAPHDTASLLLTGLFEAGAGFENFPGIPPRPPPKEGLLDGAALRFRTVTGIATIKSLSIDPQLSAIR